MFITCTFNDVLAMSQPPQENSIFRVYYIQGVINFDSYVYLNFPNDADLSGSPINNNFGISLSYNW